MADIEKLANKALKNREKFDRSVGLPLVVTKTIEAEGIRNTADVKRLRTEVLRRLRDRAKKEEHAPKKRSLAPYASEASALAHNVRFERPEDNQ